MTLYILLPVHNRAAVTRQFAAALAAQTFVDWILVLVDDGCTDGTVHEVRELIAPERLIVLAGTGSLWWAGCLQLAYEYVVRADLTSDDAVLVINDDVAFGADFLYRGMAALEVNRDACIQAMGIDRETGAVNRGVIIDSRRLLFRAAAAGERPNCLATRGLLMAARTFIDSGGFHPRWLPHYFSDYEFTIRLQRRGVSLKCVDEFWIETDAVTTGDDDYAGTGLRDFWSRTFSHRAKFNPKYASAFAIMVCPPAAIPGRLLRIWAHFARALVRALRAPRTTR